MLVAVTPYPNDPVPQIDGSYAEQSNCVCAVTADLIDASTVGAVRVSGATVRKASGVASRGISYLEAENAALKVTKPTGHPVRLTARYGLSRSTVAGTVAKQKAGCSIYTGVTRYTIRRTNYFVGDHTIYLLRTNWWPAGEKCACEKQTAVAHREFTVDDPGTTAAGYLQWSADLVYRAAEARTARYGSTGINLLVGMDTEGVSWSAIAVAAVRSEPSYSTGKQIAKTVTGHKTVGGRTQRGGGWKRPNGTVSHGWIHHQYDGVHWGWTKSRALKEAA